mmetsp:Transcript_41625/g.97865  ORF Transcript_41625/g.97865 Transcript_41625/m.97865 type:complete len:280 (-) Transcript_41625:334-1173(-)
MGVALRHHLGGEGDADRHHAGVEDGPGRHADAGLLHWLGDDGGQQRQQAADGELAARDQKGCAHAVGPAADHQHMQGPGHGRGQHPQVAHTDAEFVGAGQQKRPHQAADGRRPHRPVRHLAQQHPGQHRHQRHIHRGQEAGVGDAGELDADLLQRGTQGHQAAQAGDMPAVARFQWPAFAAEPPPLQHGQRQHDGRADQKAQAGEEHRAHVGHRMALGHEGRAPDQRDDAEQQVGAESRHQPACCRAASSASSKPAARRASRLNGARRRGAWWRSASSA